MKNTKLFLFIISIFVTMLIVGCSASVPMASKEQDTAVKAFSQPETDKAGLYVFRDTFVGQALKKSISIDGTVIGRTANKTFFFKEIAPGSHKLSTESEFGDNTITFTAEGGKNYFAEQFIKMGVFVGGAGLKMVTEEEGKKGVLNCELAK
jgi:hypothetical protein